MSAPMPAPDVLALIRRGVVIAPLPLALDAAGGLDERRQRALIRYYCAAGAGGVAVGVHTTQFEIRDPGIDLFEPLLRFASRIIDHCRLRYKRPIIKVAGVCGPTPQAVEEAGAAAAAGFDVALLSLAGLNDLSDKQLIEHCRAVAAVMPLFGFYLQPAVGGRPLSANFWRQFVEIDNVVGVKIAPFNRYHTLDVVRAVALAGRQDAVTLYTGNDDNIIMDLLTPFPVHTPGGGSVTMRIRGGLLGQWSVWTHRAVELMEFIHSVVEFGKAVPHDLMLKHAALTDANAVIFDAAHNFAGCIPGIHEVLRRQGLMGSTACLDASLKLSPGQPEELDRIQREYPWLTDDDFVHKHLDEWLKD